MENSKSGFAESLLEVLKENQKTLNHVIRIAGIPQEAPEYNKSPQQTIQPMQTNGGGVTLSEVLDRMSELIELNKVTLQTIDLLDKRIKRLHIAIDNKVPSATEQTEDVNVEDYVEGQ